MQQRGAGSPLASICGNGQCGGRPPPARTTGANPKSEEGSRRGLGDAIGGLKQYLEKSTVPVGQREVLTPKPSVDSAGPEHTLRDGSFHP